MKTSSNMRGLIAGLISISFIGCMDVYANDETNTLSGASSFMLVSMCVACHGKGGNSAGPAIPIIAGLSPYYFVNLMQDFKAGTRSSTVMGIIAKGYTNGEIRQMSEYFGKQAFLAAQGQLVDSEAAIKGAALHKVYCEKCHSSEGTSADDDAGILKGQWRLYLKIAMAEFISGERLAPRKMRKRVKKLLRKEGREGLDLLIDFYSSTPGRLSEN